MVGQPRLDHHAGAVAIGRGDDAVLDLLQRAFGFEQFDHPLAGIEAVEADQLGGHQAVLRLDDTARRIEHVEHVARP